MRKIAEESQPIPEKPIVRFLQHKNEDWKLSTPSHVLNACKSAIIKKYAAPSSKKDRIPAKSWEPKKCVVAAVEAALQDLEMREEGGPKLKSRNLQFEKLISLEGGESLSQEQLWAYKNHIFGKSIYSKILTKHLTHLIAELDQSGIITSGSGYRKKILSDLDGLAKSVDQTRTLGFKLSTLKQGTEAISKQLRADANSNLAEQLEQQQAKVASLKAAKQKKLEQVLETQKFANILADENRSIRAAIREQQSSKVAQRTMANTIEPEQSKSGYSVFSLTDLDSKNLLDSKLYKNN